MPAWFFAFLMFFVFVVFFVPVVRLSPLRQQVEAYRAFLTAAMSVSYFARITSHR
jgi:hypothetical protein